MPAFVPVFDPEVPRSEQDPNSQKLLKHRKWDNPHSVIPVSKKDSSDRHSHSLKYYRDKYNDNNNSDKNLDSRFYRKPVRDDFDYAPRKKKKTSKPSHPDSDHRTQSDRKKVSKDLKKDRSEHKHK